jgi:hypothetical protein
MTRIALIHATPVAIGPVAAAFAELWPEAEVYNLLEDSLAPDLERAGRIDDAMTERFRRLALYARDCGADGILFTCSAFGTAIEAAAADLAPLPVLKPNEAMFADALKAGSKLGMVATFGPSVPSMEREFEEMKAGLNPAATLETVCVTEAMAKLKAGDAAGHNALVAEAAKKLTHCDAVMLAHFSTAQALSAVRAAVTRPVLTNPASAVAMLRGGES